MPRGAACPEALATSDMAMTSRTEIDATCMGDARTNRDDFDTSPLAGGPIACFDGIVTNIAQVGRIAGVPGLLAPDPR